METSDCESDAELSCISTIVRDLDKSVKEQKKMLLEIVKKQDAITRAVRNIENRLNNIDITLAEQGKSMDLVHSEVKELRDKQLQSTTAQQEIVKRADDQQHLINSLME